jgi:hypothetical protein
MDVQIGQVMKNASLKWRIIKSFAGRGEISLPVKLFRELQVTSDCTGRALLNGASPAFQ